MPIRKGRKKRRLARKRIEHKGVRTIILTDVCRCSCGKLLLGNIIDAHERKGHIPSPIDLQVSWQIEVEMIGKGGE